MNESRIVRLFGVKLTCENMSQAVRHVLESAASGAGGCVTSLAVHGLVTAARNADYRERLEDFDVVASDGQPVRWALNLFGRAAITGRVAGTDFMQQICEECARHRIGVFLYGSTAQTNERLARELSRRYPTLLISGREPSVFRPLSTSEDAELVSRVNGSGASVLFLGLGCPLQENFAFAHIGKFLPVQVCVGAAFDVHAGTRPRAPRIMQAWGLEWLFRLAQEPRRLVRRYATTNLMFVYLLCREAGPRFFRRGPTA